MPNPLDRLDALTNDDEDDQGNTSPTADTSDQANTSDPDPLARLDSLTSGDGAPADDTPDQPDPLARLDSLEASASPQERDAPPLDEAVGSALEIDGTLADEQRRRMQVFQSALEKRQQAPDRIESELDTGEAADRDPGVGPGDQSQAEAEEEQSQFEAAVQTGLTMAQAAKPGTPENRQMVRATWNGIRRSVQQLQAGAAATHLITGDTAESPSIPDVLGGGRPSVRAGGFRQQLTPEQEAELKAEDRRQIQEARMQSAEEYVRSMQNLERLGQPQAVRQAAQAEGMFGALAAVAEDPHVAVPSLVASSAIQSTPPAVGAIVGAASGGAPGAAAGQFIGTMGVEAQASMSNFLAESGVDISDPAQVLAATADPKMRREIRNRALARGAAVGSVDALFGAVTAGMSTLGISPVTKTVGGFGLETVGEGTSELAGQGAAGEEINTAEAALESVAAMGQSGATSLGTVAVSELLPSERRVRNELQRQIEENEASLEVPEGQIETMMRNAIENGGLSSPRSAAEQELNRAINEGEITVERPTEPTDETDGRTPATPDRDAEGETEPDGGRGQDDASRGGQPPGAAPEAEGDPQGQREGDETAGRGGGRETRPVEPDTDPTQPGGMRARREPATAVQRAEALGVADLFTNDPNIEDVADLEQAAALFEDADPQTVEERRTQIEEMLERVQIQRTVPPEERPDDFEPVDADPQKLRAMDRLAEQAMETDEAGLTGDEEPAAEPEVPEPGEPREDFLQNVTDAPTEELAAAAENPELQPGEAEAIQAEVQNRVESSAIDPDQADQILQSLPETEQPAQDGGAPAASREAPRAEDLEEGTRLVDVGGTERRTVEVAGSPNARTIPVRPKGAGEGQETLALLQNLRRPGQADEEPPATTFPEAPIDEGGTAELNEQWQVVPEGATVPEGADVRFDLGQSDLPAARMPTEQDRERSSAESDRADIQGTEREMSLDELVQRAPIQQEERITEQVEAVERELEQAKNQLQNLKARRPEQQEQEGQATGSLFGDNEDTGQGPGQQASLGNQFERSAETTEELQQMIDDQRAYVDRLQQELVDLRRRAPEARSEARRQQTDITDQIDQERQDREGEPTAPEPPEMESAAPPLDAADVSAAPNSELSPEPFRDRRSAAIKADLMSVVRDRFSGDQPVENNLTDLARTLDRIRELRESADRDLVSSALVEDNVAVMLDDVDQLIAELGGRLHDRELQALRNRARAWASQTGVPDSPSRLHLNQIGAGRQVGPQYEAEDGYQVQPDGDGGLEVISPNTGEPVGRRSSRYDDVVVEYFRENSEQIDQTPRITDGEVEISLDQWTAASRRSQNPFEVIEGMVLADKNEAFNPVTLELKKVTKESLQTYFETGELGEQNVLNWVDPDGTELAAISQSLKVNWGIEVSPQELVDQWITEYPGGPSTVERQSDPEPFVEQFENVTGLPASEDLLRRIYQEVYQQPSTQTADDQGTDAPFEPEAPYIDRGVNQRSGPYEKSGGRHRRRRDGKSLREIAEEGYELREGASDAMRATGLRAMEQLSLFGPPDGATQGERELQQEAEPDAETEGTDTDETADTGETEPETAPPFTEPTDEPGDRSRPMTSEMQRMEEGFFGRAITDDLAEEGGASLVGRTVSGPDDLAALAQVLRDPRFETFRVFFVRDVGDGGQEVRHHTAVSQRMPSMSTAFPVEADGSAHLPSDVDRSELDDWENLHYWMSHKMDEVGADGYYLMHNHPSGRTDPSMADRSLTEKIVATNEGFKGHIIIDSGEFTVIDVEPMSARSVDVLRQTFRDAVDSAEPGSAAIKRAVSEASRGLQTDERRETFSDPETLERAGFEQTESTDREVSEMGPIEMNRPGLEVVSQFDRLLTPSIQHPQLNQKISDDGDLARIASRASKDRDAPILILRGSNGKVRGLMEVSTEFFRLSDRVNIRSQVLQAARYAGASKAFIANVPEDILPTIQREFKEGTFRDFVTQGGRSSADMGMDQGAAARQNQFGFNRDEVDPIRVREEGEGYTRDLRDEIRRRVGRLQHEAPQQAEPAADSGPSDGEQIRQAAIRVEGQLYRGLVHPEAVQAAINDGALVETEAGVQMPDGRPLRQAEQDGDVSLQLYTTTQGRVVAQQQTGKVLGVDRADNPDAGRRPEPRRVLERPPDPREVARQLTALETHGARVEASENLPDGANSVDMTLQSMSDEERQRHEFERSLTDETINGDNPISAPEIIQGYLDVIRAAGREVPLRYGRYRGFSFSASGVFKVEPEVIRLEEANDIPTAAHEMGHALEKAVFGWVDGSPWQEAVAGTDGQVQSELVQLGEDLYGDRSPNGGYKREGWAEFLKYYMLDRSHVEERAPETLDWFENTFMENHPAIAEQIERSRSRSRRWYDQGSLKRAQASVEKNRTFWQNFKERIRTQAGRDRMQTVFSQGALTEFSPLLRLVEEAEERMGESLPVDENPFLTAEALQKTHAARTRMFVEQGTFDFAGNPVGPPLRDAASIVEGQRDEFTLYLWARRAIKLWEGREAKYDEDGTLIQTEKEPRNPGLSKEDAEYIFDYYDSEDFRHAADMVYQWNNEVLDYTKAAFDEQMAERVKGGDVGDYIPLQRVFNELNQQVVETREAATGGSVLGADPINALEGSTRRIRDPFQTMIEQAEQLIRATHERYVLNQLIQIGQNVEGMGRFIEEVPQDQLPTRVSVERIVDDLRDEGLVIDLPQGELNAKIERVAEQFEDGRRPDMEESEIEEVAREELMQEKLGGFLTFFKPAIVPEGGGDPIVSIQDPETGDVQWFELSRELYDTFEGLDIYRLPWYLDLLFGVTARLFRLGTTGVRASFALITNPVRDFQTLLAQSRSELNNSGSLFINYLRSMGAGIQSVAQDDIEVDPSFARFMRLGGSISRPLGVDTQETKRAVREIFQNRAVRIIKPQNWIDHLRDVFQIPEGAARVAEFKERADEIGWEEGTNMSDGQALQLLLDAKRVTTDFTSQGKYTKVLNQMVPFVTATIGGQRAFFRAFEQNPKRAIAAASTLAAATLGYWWLRRDEEWYKDIPAREKLNNWFFPVGDDGPVIVLPRPFEWGATFSSIPEALVGGWYEQDPEAATDAIGHLYSNWSPLGTTNIAGAKLPVGFPVPLQVGAEQLANEQFYFNSPIVPKGEQRKPAAEQFGPYTSTVAIQIGRALGASPRRIDHLIAGFLGGVGRDMTDAADSLLRTLGLEGASPATQQEMTESDLPIVGSLFRRGRRASTNSESVNEFYERLEQAQTRRASDVMEETTRQRQVRLMLSDAQKALSVLYFVRKHTKDAEDRRRLNVEIRRLAADATQAADADLPKVMQKRSEFGPMRELDQAAGSDRFDPELIRDLVRSVNPQAVPDEEEGAEAGGAPQTGGASPTP